MAARTDSQFNGHGAPSPFRAAASRLRWVLPYLPILPALIALLVMLGYPVLLVILISFQKFGFAELVQRKTVYIGLANYTQILGDPIFLAVVVRTVLFTLSVVSLTMVLGTAVALLMDRLGGRMRLLLSIGMILAWATPVVASTVVFQWLFDSKLGVVNWLLTAIGLFGDFTNHSWFESGFSTFAIITLLIVWQAIPFVAFSLYAGILTIPRELYETARVEGAGEWTMFRRITLPMLAPLFMILVFLSAIWDFKAFTQVYAMRQGGPAGQTVTLSLYAYIQGISQSQFGRAAAASVIMVLLLLLLLVPYLRRLLRTLEE
jgi:N,N'-diacetylchitobiose transport system permease protein